MESIQNISMFSKIKSRKNVRKQSKVESLNMKANVFVTVIIFALKDVLIVEVYVL